MGHAACSRLRYDKRADVHEAFLSFACALICWHALRRSWMLRLEPVTKP
jgi:hypothetical protein